jgi:hypothetical protein
VSVPVLSWHRPTVRWQGPATRPTIKIGDSSELDGVSCLAKSNCLAVGLYATGVKWVVG